MLQAARGQEQHIAALVRPIDDDIVTARRNSGLVVAKRDQIWVVGDIGRELAGLDAGDDALAVGAVPSEISLQPDLRERRPSQHRQRQRANQEGRGRSRAVSQRTRVSRNADHRQQAKNANAASGRTGAGPASKASPPSAFRMSRSTARDDRNRRGTPTGWRGPTTLPVRPSSFALPVPSFKVGRRRGPARSMRDCPPPLTRR